MSDNELIPEFPPLTDAELALPATSEVEQSSTERRVMPVPREAPKPPLRHPKHGFPSKVWTYKDLEGNVNFHVCRFDPPDSRKEIVPVSFWRNSEGQPVWRWKWPPEPRPLYNLDQLSARPEAQVVIVEGEKAADAAAKLFPDRVAVTWSSGSNAVSKSDFAPLRGRNVFLWPDNDDPGRKAMEQVARNLADLGCDVSLIDAAALAAIEPDNAASGRQALEGWDAADAIEEWKDHDMLRRAVDLHVTKLEPPRYFRFGKYEMTPEGLTVEIEKKSGKFIVNSSKLVCAPFEVIGKLRNTDGLGWSKLIRWEDDDHRFHEHLVPDGSLHGDPSIFSAELASKGLKIQLGEGKHLADYLINVPVETKITMVERNGWHDAGGHWIWASPTGVLSSGQGETIFLSGASETRFAMAGTLDEWKESVGTFVKGHPRPMFCVMCALAGPLIGPMKLTGVGFHLFGHSSIGKSTAVEVAASAWGEGSTHGFVRSWRATANGLEALASQHSDAVLILDELSLVDATAAHSAIYSLIGGIGRSRMGREISLRATLNWRAVLLSTGEIPLEVKLAEAGKKVMAGQAARVPDIQADAGKGFGIFNHAGPFENSRQLADAIKSATRAHYGTAGPAFVQELIALGRNQVIEKVAALMHEFRGRLKISGSDGQVGRVADSFGIVAAAGELAIELGILAWSPGEGMQAAETCFKAWFEARGGTEPLERQQALAQVRHFYELHGFSRFAERLKEPPPGIRDQAGYWSKHGDDWIFYTSQEVFKKEVCAGFDHKQVARWLHEEKILVRQGDRMTIAAKFARNSKKTMQFYGLRLSNLHRTEVEDSDDDVDKDEPM